MINKTKSDGLYKITQSKGDSALDRSSNRCAVAERPGHTSSLSTSRDTEHLMVGAKSSIYPMSV